MPSTIRRSEQLQKRIQRRNNSLKPADFTKVQTPVSNIETKVDPVEKSKAALSDLRKRIDERKRYQEKREDPIPELTRETFSESPMSQRQEPSSPKPEVSTRAVARSAAPVGGNTPSGGLRNHYKDHADRYRKNANQENIEISEDKAPPSHIEVSSENKPDDDTEVSEITTDVRIMSAKGAAYAERRMAGNIQARLAKPSLSTPTGRLSLSTPTGGQIERDVSINVSNLRNLGKAVEQAKMDMQKELSPVNGTGMRHGLPYESTDYRPSVDEDESTWGDAIRTEQQEQFIADKNTANKLSNLVKEAYSYEGDVFIDATDIREEDLDDQNKNVVDDNDASPMEAEDDEVEQFHSSEQHEETDEMPQQSREEVNELEYEEDDLSNADDMDRENAEGEEEPSEEKPSEFASNPAAMASEFFNSSVGFFKSFGDQVDTQLKSLQQQGLISKNNVDGMLGILKRDVKETEKKLPKDTDDAVIFLGDEFEASVCGSNLEAVEDMKANAGSQSVEKMLESLKKSYNLGIAKCGLDSDLIKENTKAIEQMVANLKNANGGANETTEDDIDGAVFQELSAQRAEENMNDPAPLTGANGVMLSVNMPENE
eukprot:CAMPEP_0116136044 /NCGR_PEP_ID=MMETSP0329-20121206/11511_1 /TAXON_ID=697910 /ORGANISM="Pseudo-nitzschia arenysensis, Strain B593" /LENGTH=599 /DNA_ID=CAMNT_0003630879 /DNA_START=86 /DNA_END=1885 /DNA_ORIENTATION=+